MYIKLNDSISENVHVAFLQYLNDTCVFGTAMRNIISVFDMSRLVNGPFFRYLKRCFGTAERKIYLFLFVQAFLYIPTVVKQNTYLRI